MKKTKYHLCDSKQHIPRDHMCPLRQGGGRAGALFPRGTRAPGCWGCPPPGPGDDPSGHLHPLRVVRKSPAGPGDYHAGTLRGGRARQEGRSRMKDSTSELHSGKQQASNLGTRADEELTARMLGPLSLKEKGRGSDPENSQRSTVAKGIPWG